LKCGVTFWEEINHYGADMQTAGHISRVNNSVWLILGVLYNAIKSFVSSTCVSMTQYMCVCDPVHVCLWPSTCVSMTQCMCVYDPVHVCLWPSTCVSMTQYMCVWPSTCVSMTQYMCVWPSTCVCDPVHVCVTQYMCVYDPVHVSMTQYMCLWPSTCVCDPVHVCLWPSTCVSVTQYQHLHRWTDSVKRSVWQTFSKCWRSSLIFSHNDS
jgi:hypothetical protein